MTTLIRKDLNDLSIVSLMDVERAIALSDNLISEDPSVVLRTQEELLAVIGKRNKKIDGIEWARQEAQRSLDWITSQEEEIQSILDQIDELDNININMIPIMLKMIDALDKFVTLDIPFLITERTERVDNLKSIMDRGDISTSEKFRKVTEAYQIESDYGRTIEAYRSEVEFDGETFNADFLRVGRVSLAFVTSSGDKAGFWNKSTGRWEESSAAVKRSTIDGLKIALKQAPPTLITIPLTSYENSN